MSACAGTYRDAYMSLSAAAVFAPFVRAELLQWDPLFTGPVGAHLPALQYTCRCGGSGELCCHAHYISDAL